MNKNIVLAALLCVFSACGGGGGGISDSGILVEGLLTQGESAEHSRSIANLRHSAGQTIEEVTICGLGECSVTDDAGQYGFLAPAEFKAGEVLFSIQGHGIDTTKVVDIPANASEVFIHFEHADNQVKVHHLLVDGQEAEEHSSEQGHSEHTHSDEESHSNKGESIQLADPDNLGSDHAETEHTEEHSHE